MNLIGTGRNTYLIIYHSETEEYCSAKTFKADSVEEIKKVAAFHAPKQALSFEIVPVG
jgi:hypothetical protein